MVLDLPARSVMLALPPAELAGFLLMEALRLWRSNVQANPDNPTGLTFRSIVPTDQRRDEDERLALAEAWSWLLREGLLVSHVPPGIAIEPVALTPSRRARALRTLEDFAQLRDQRLLPRQLLHPAVLLEIETDFTTGHYDTAVMKAFRQVEIAVRVASGLGEHLVGVKLMREAFDDRRGPLADMQLVEPERQAMAHVFAGAMGLFRNPPSHRDVGLGAEETIELFIVASHLMRIVDERRAALAGVAASTP